MKFITKSSALYFVIAHQEEIFYINFVNFTCFCFKIMDDDNWLTVGKPKKIKTGEKKIENGENGKKI